MKLAVFFSAIVVISFFAVPVAFAATNAITVVHGGGDSETTVNQELQLKSTIVCLDGTCTRTITEEKNEGTVCINGECITSTDGELTAQSDDGKTTVWISKKNY